MSGEKLYCVNATVAQSNNPLDKNIHSPFWGSHDALSRWACLELSIAGSGKIITKTIATHGSRIINMSGAK